MTTWIQEYTTDWTAQSRTNNPATTAISTLGLGWTDNVGNCWYTEGGSVVSAAGSGGAWTVAPTATFAAANGSGSRKVTAAGTVALSGGALGAVTMTNCGRDYTSAPTVTLSGGTGSGGSVVATLKSTTSLQVALGSASYGQYGSQSWLYRPAGALDQRIVVRVLCSATTDQVPILTRLDPATKRMYSCVVGFSTAAPNLSAYYFNDYPTNAATTKISAVQFSGGIQAVVGHTYDIDVSATGSNPTTITTTITDVDSGLSATQTTTGSEAGVQAANNIGVGQFTNILEILSMTAYQPLGLQVSPTSESLNLTNASLTLTGAGTSWTAGSPGLPLFGLNNSGGTNASIVSQTVASSTSATLVINTGSVAGNITIVDGSTGTTQVVSLVPIVPPAATIDIATITSSGCTIAANAYPTSGTAPYTADLYRSPNSGFAYNDGSGTQISHQTGLSNTVVPTTVVDTTAPIGLQFYRWVITDAAGQIVSGTQAQAQRYVDAPLTVMCIGDSNTNGHTASSLVQQANQIGVITRGSGQTPGTYDVTHATNTQFLGKVIIGADGLIQRAYVVKHGYGITSETAPGSVSFSGAGGTPGTLSLITTVAAVYAPAGNVGGGFPLVGEIVLRAAYKFRNVKVKNQGVGGSAASTWMPHGAVLISGATNASPIAVSTSSPHGLTTGQPYEVRRVGGNTAANGTWYISSTGSQTFTLFQDAGLTQPVAGNGAYVAGTGAVISPGATTGVLGYCLENAKSVAVDGTTTPIWHMMFGANDANGSTSAATYQQQMDIIIDDLIRWGASKVMVSDYFFWTSGTEAKNLLLQQYAAANTALVATFPGRCLHGMTGLSGMTANYPFLLGGDGLHGNDAGYATMGGILAGVLAPVIGLIHKAQNVTFI